MRHAKRFGSVFLSLLLVLSVLAGCSGAKQSSPTAEGKSPKKLLIWMKLSTEEEAELQKLAQEWATQTGNTVEMIHYDGGYSEFAAAVQASQAPDLWLGMAHDNLGNLTKANLIDPVPAGLINTADFVPVSISASTVGGKLMAVPLTMESIGLLYNKQKVSKVPATFDELIEQAKTVGFTYDVTNFYFSFGFIAGFGGYVFKDTNGTLDPNAVGLATPEAKQALQYIADLASKHKLVNKDLTYDISAGLFSSGKAAFAIDGPWAVKGAKDQGIDVGVIPVPDLPGGRKFKPFVGVQTAVVVAKSSNKAEAWDLTRYLAEKAPEPLLQSGHIAVVQNALETDSFKQNEILSAIAVSAANGTPMPNIPEMPAVWTPAKEMLVLVVGGTDPATAADQAVVQIMNAIKSQ